MQTRNRTVRGGRGSPPRKSAPWAPPPARKKKGGRKKNDGLVNVVVHRKDAKGDTHTNKLVCQRTDTIGDFHNGMLHNYSGMKNKGSAVAYSQSNKELGLGFCVGDLEVVNDTANISAKLNELNDPSDVGSKAGSNGEVTGALRVLFI